MDGRLAAGSEPKRLPRQWNRRHAPTVAGDARVGGTHLRDRSEPVMIVRWSQFCGQDVDGPDRDQRHRTSATADLHGHQHLRPARQRQRVGRGENAVELVNHRLEVVDDSPVPVRIDPLVGHLREQEVGRGLGVSARSTGPPRSYRQ